MGERPDSILGVGCPSSDIARQLDLELDPQVVNGTGSGTQIDLAKPFLLVMFHPTTTSYGGEQSQIEEVLNALEQLKLPTVMLWPNIDAGSDRISKAIRVFRDRVSPDWLRTITNLPPEDYLRLLAKASSAVGNSSSFVRDAGYLGTPVVLVGARQEGREVGEHVTPVLPIEDTIAQAISTQMSHGRYAPCTLYGDGYVADKIANALAALTPYKQKRLHYIYDSETNDTSTSDRDGARGFEGNSAKKSGATSRKTVIGLHG